MNKLIAILLLAAMAGCKNKTTGTEVTVVTKENETVNDAGTGYERFSGDWYYENPQNGKIESTFALHLQTGHTAIKGNFCAVAQYGNKIDCTDDKLLDNISGTIKNDTAFVNFTGIYNNKATGKAKLYFENGSLVWQLLSVTGDVYVPKMVMLTMDAKPAQSTPPAENNFPIGGKDIKSLPFTKIKEQLIGLEDYYCGITPDFYELPMVSKYQVKIISNSCGDFPFYALVTTYKGQLTDKKIIYRQDWTNPKNEKEKSSTDFIISKDYIITITEKQNLGGNHYTKSKPFAINTQTGKIVPVEIRLK